MRSFYIILLGISASLCQSNLSLHYERMTLDSNTVAMDSITVSFSPDKEMQKELARKNHRMKSIKYQIQIDFVVYSKKGERKRLGPIFTKGFDFSSHGNLIEFPTAQFDDIEGKITESDVQSFDVEIYYKVDIILQNGEVFHRKEKLPTIKRIN